MDGRKRKRQMFLLIIIFQRNICSCLLDPYFCSPNSGSRSSTIDHASTGTVPCVNVNQAVKGWKKPRIFLLVRTELWDPRYGDRRHDSNAKCSNRVVNSARKLTSQLASTAVAERSSGCRLSVSLTQRL